MTMDEQLLDLADEIKRQDVKHGRFKTSDGTDLGRSRLALACLDDEVAEAHDAWRRERGVPWDDLRTELLQVAAVAMRALRDL